MQRTTLLPDDAVLGSRNALLTATARRHFVREYPGPLSIKAVLDGRVCWKTEGRESWADPFAFLVLNDGEPYSMELDSPQPVTTCCVFFEQGFVERLARDLTGLDYSPEPAGAITFLSRLHPAAGSPIVPALEHLRGRAIEGACPLEMDQLFLGLAWRLLALNSEIRTQIARIPAAKAATREEMLRRASRGREFLHAHAHDSVRLADAARAGCLSTYHFHRVFRTAFGETPHTYVTRVRLEHAKQMLARGVPVTEACTAVGFSSLGSFSALFRRRFGVVPSRIAP